MKYIGMPLSMWLLYQKSFRVHLVSVLGYSPREAQEITAKAKPKYRAIIEKLPEFEKADRFKMNIVNCALLCSFLLSMDKRPDVEKATVFYARAMMTAPTRWFCSMSGKRKFTEADLQSMRDTAALKAADRNPYSWNMEYLPYPDGSGYEARFTKCGICTLMKELGLFELTPAMCYLDYTMSEAEDLRELVLLRTLSQKLMGRIERNYRFVMGFNGALIALGAIGILPPATSALLHNSSTLLLSMDCMTPLLRQKKLAPLRFRQV